VHNFVFTFSKWCVTLIHSWFCGRCLCFVFLCGGWFSRYITVVLKFFSLELILIFNNWSWNFEKRKSKNCPDNFWFFTGLFHENCWFYEILK
jgi:hypothetical protein